MELYNFFHNVWAVCSWLVPTLIVAALMVIMGLVHWRNQRKRDKDFEKSMEEQRAEKAAAAEALENAVDEAPAAE